MDGWLVGWLVLLLLARGHKANKIQFPNDIKLTKAQTKRKSVASSSYFDKGDGCTVGWLVDWLRNEYIAEGVECP